MEPLAAKGRPRGDFATHGVDFEGSRKSIDFRSPLGSPKSRWMFAFGRLGGSIFPPAVRRELGGGVRFEKGVPRAALVRARLIDKLIRFRELIIFRIFETTNA